MLAGGHELLGQQIPESAGRLDRPRPLFEGRRPLEQLVELATTRPHLQLRKLCFARSITTAVCDPLWGSTPIITSTASSSIALTDRGGHS
jgi:hypothetical protein